MSARPNALMKGVVGVQLLSGSPLPTRPYWASLLFIGKVIVSHYVLTALAANEAHRWHIANRKQSDLVQVF